ncbi:MAG: aldehyde dehydrogenase family protein [Nitratireductor sp.]|nr:aldehyde dehydrogenase family protein [Nitratireductor sp.]
MPAHANCDLANFVDGEWLDADGREDEEVVNPATGETLAVLPHASEADLERATAAAARMLPQWHSAPAFERSKVLRKAADLLRERVERIATSMTLEQGKTIAESRMEILASADVIDWSAEGARRTCGRVIPERHSRLDDRTSGNGRRYPDRRCNGPLPRKIKFANICAAGSLPIRSSDLLPQSARACLRSTIQRRAGSRHYRHRNRSCHHRRRNGPTA